MISSASTSAPLVQSDCWLHALTLAERTHILKTKLIAQPGAAAIERRAGRWRSQTPFGSTMSFDERLALVGLDWSQFEGIVDGGIDQLRNLASTPPPWMALCEETLIDPGAAGATPSPQSSGFLRAVEPLLGRGIARLAAALEEPFAASAAPLTTDGFVPLVLPYLTQTLTSRLMRTLVLELNVARLRGELRGAEPESRFADFIERIGTAAGRRSIFSEYPVLGRQLAATVNDWVAFCTEFGTHLARDWDAVASLCPPSNGPRSLAALTFGAGDSHRGGRSVVIVHFAGDGRVVYKPRSLSVDQHFNDVLGWLAEHVPAPHLRPMRVLDRGSYGWAEFISAEPCGSLAEVERFYVRQGRLLALLYLLDATDMHLENVIAHGEHPLCVDLEALFHPRLPTAAADDVFTDVVSTSVVNSVLRVALLPARIWSVGNEDGIDMSGLGGAAGQRTPYRVLRVERDGTDEMRFVRKQVETTGSDNRPRIGDRDVDLRDHVSSLVEGFRQTYEAVMANREAWLRPDGLIKRFDHDQVRAVVRPTRTYGVVLQESFHPNVLRDALDRDQLFDRLWSGLRHRGRLAAVVPSEQDDLRRGDIPVFHSTPSSTDLITSTGQVLEHVFDRCSGDVVRERIESLSAADLTRQQWFIRASVATLSAGLSGLSYAPPEPRAWEDVEVQCPDVVRRVVERMEALALREQDHVWWLGMVLIRERVWQTAPTGPTLYDGLYGIALFLAYAAREYGFERCEELSRAVFRTAWRQMMPFFERRDFNGPVGGFSGLGSIIYSLSHLGAVWGDRSLLETAREIALGAAETIETDSAYDVISGSAGLIGALLVLDRLLDDPAIERSARRAGDHLVASAIEAGGGLGWPPHGGGTRPLAGFAHGNAGIACFLDLLAVRTGERKYAATAAAARTYEDSLYREQHGNWIDVREIAQGGSDHQFMVAWCHGAPGVGMARLRAGHVAQSPDVLRDVRRAVATTLRTGFGVNHSLCHGDLGNLDFLQVAAAADPNAEWIPAFHRRRAEVLATLDRGEWRCGIPLAVETPGLMMGLAGIGLGVMRLDRPARVPCVLTLDPPVA